MKLAGISRVFCRKPAGNTVGDTPAAALRETVVALFGSAVLEYLMEYRTTNAEFVHTIAYGKMMAYRQLAVVLGDGALTAQLDEEISRVLESRRSNKK